MTISSKHFYCLLAITTATLWFVSVQAQSTSDTQHYRLFSMGGNRPVYRDFATSPLFYNGTGISLSTTWLKRSNERERSIDLSLRPGWVSAQIPESDFIQPSSSAFFLQMSFRYQQLRKLKSVSNEKQNIKIGGTFISTQNFRPNPNLQNNSLGLENLTNLMVSGQIVRDVSRTKERTLNLFICKPKLKPVKRDLRFQLNAGLLNFNHRPGYAYSRAGEINGVKTNPLSWQLSNYNWSMNGWRFITELEWITYLPNGNARSWAYVWDAAHAPGKFEAFQVANHNIRFTYYFNSKKR